jgi:hypothetical protein
MKIRSLKVIQKIIGTDKASLIANIRNHYKLSGNPEQLKARTSCAFELLISEWLAIVWQVDLYDQTQEGKKLHVKWLGKRLKLSSSGNGTADSMGFFNGYQIVVEFTLETSAHQVSKEFSQSTRHYDQLVDNRTIDKDNSFLILISPEIHQDTFKHFKADNYRCILLNQDHLRAITDKIVRMAEYHIPTSHFRLKELLITTARLLERSTRISEYNSAFEDAVNKWYEENLRDAYLEMIAVNSYSFLKDAYNSNRKLVGASEILKALTTIKKLQQFVKEVSKSISADDISSAVTRYHIAKVTELSYEYEPFFTPFNYLDIKFSYISFLNEIAE